MLRGCGAMPADVAELRDSLALTDKRKERRVRIAGHDVVIRQDPRPLSTGMRMWSSPFKMVAYMERGPRARRRLCPGIDLASARVCELGAGCSGLPGLAFAIRGATVALT